MSVAIEIGINPGQLYSWVNNYKIYGYIYMRFML